MSLLELKNISKIFKQASRLIEVLKSCDLILEQGQILSLLGPSGSGKSTLLSLIAGLDQPDSGKIIFSREDITSLSEEKWTTFRATHYGVVFQQFHLISHLTALENVMLPLEILNKPKAKENALALLEKVELADRLTHYPDQLSGGECQRVAIARALVHQPPLLLADEPTGNLDVKTGSIITNLLFQLVKSQNTALILVTHDENLAARCDRILRLKEGKLTEDFKKETHAAS